MLLASACGGSDGSTTTASADDESAATTQAPATATEATDSTAGGVRLISATDGAAIQNDPPADLVILDVRTPEEFTEARLDGAVMLDFYREDFADRLAELDPDVPYLLYCRSGNRSGQTADIMKQLGFADVADVDGGIISWSAANLPTVEG